MNEREFSKALTYIQKFKLVCSNFSVWYRLTCDRYTKIDHYPAKTYHSSHNRSPLHPKNQIVRYLKFTESNDFHSIHN